MSEILLDSDVIIAWLRGYSPFSELLPELIGGGDVLAWTPVSVAEIFAGLRKGEEDQIENLFVILETLPVSRDAGRKAGHYLRMYSKSHSVELGDALIAATAHINELPLWTLNKKHYPMRDISFYSPPA